MTTILPITIWPNYTVTLITINFVTSTVVFVANHLILTCYILDLVFRRDKGTQAWPYLRHYCYNVTYHVLFISDTLNRSNHRVSTDYSSIRRHSFVRSSVSKFYSIPNYYLSYGTFHFRIESYVVLFCVYAAEPRNYGEL